MTLSPAASDARSRQYPPISLAVDVVIFSVLDGSLQVLLIQRGGEPFRGSWALPGGFVEVDESLDSAALRELEEETGLSGAYLEQLHTYGNPGRDPRGRVVSVVYFALVPGSITSMARSGSDAARASWFLVDALPSLAFDHAVILADAIAEVKARRLFP